MENVFNLANKLGISLDSEEKLHYDVSFHEVNEPKDAQHEHALEHENVVEG